MTKIKQLEGELNQKINELNESLNTQYLLYETLKNNTKTLGEIESLLKIVETKLKYSNDYIQSLKRENSSLKLSCDVWMKQAIKLEFQVLSARDATKKKK
ncbi:MAG: hypothetical protein WAW41_21650 [Methylobacter sp.]